LGDLIKILSKKYPGAKSKGDAALAVIRDAKIFAEKRNELIHSRADSLLNELTYRQETVDTDLRRIQSLSAHASLLEERLFEACGAFIFDFRMIRDPKNSKPPRPLTTRRAKVIVSRR
jgi:hypothetical protein